MLEADFVIVGSGSAGAALAYRLSEDGKHSVIVIEYGGSDAGPLIQMPAALSFPMNMCALRLGLCDRARAASRRPRACHAARQGDRRLVVDQRHGLCARPCQRLRPLGRTGRDRLGLRRRAPLFQAHGDMRTAARTAGAAATGRCMCAAARASTRSTTPSSRPAARPASRLTDDYNGAKQEGFGADGADHLSAAAAGRPPTPICGRR